MLLSGLWPLLFPRLLSPEPGQRGGPQQRDGGQPRGVGQHGGDPGALPAPAEQLVQAGMEEQEQEEAEGAG